MSKMITGGKGVVRKHPLEVQMQIRRLEDNNVKEDNNGKEDGGDSKPEYQYVTNDALSEDIRTKFSAENYCIEEPKPQTLLKNMLAAMPKDAEQWFDKQKLHKEISITPQAHHIVAGNTLSAQVSRSNLEKYKIKINDPRNGILLPPTLKSNAIGSIHWGQQNGEYDRYVLNRLTTVLDCSCGFEEQRDKIFQVLDDIKEELYTGNRFLNKYTIAVEPKHQPKPKPLVRKKRKIVI